MVQGPWDDPLIFPDPESLIRQSPAASPFLDLLKQRITGGGKPAAQDASPTADNAREGAKENAKSN
jgi:AsmA protein